MRGFMAGHEANIGIEPTDAEVEGIVERLFGVEDVQSFTQTDYDRHC